MAFKRDEAYDEQFKCVKRIIGSLLMYPVFAYLTLLVLIPLTQFIIDGFGVNSLGRAWNGVWKNTFNFRMIYRIFHSYQMTLKTQGNPSPIMYLPYLSFIWPFIWVIYMIITNPYNYRPNVFGSGRKATYADVEKMGLFKGFVIVLGRLWWWRHREPVRRRVL